MDTQMEQAAASAPSRRSRMRRQSVGKHIELTARDLEVFAALTRYRYLRSTYLHAFAGGASQTRFLERLGALYHDGRYIDRPKAQWDTADARCAPAVYELDRRGQDALMEAGMFPAPAVIWSRREGATPHFRHALMTCEVLASLELGIRATPNVRFVPVGEVVARVPGVPLCFPVQIGGTACSVVPDALFGVEYTAGASRSYRFFALEVERRNRVDCGNLTQTSWRKKVLGYRDVVARKTYARLGIPNLLVLAVAPSAAHIESMQKLVLQVTEGKGSPLFMFTAFPDEHKRPMPELFSGAWARAGKSDFQMNTA